MSTNNQRKEVIKRSELFMMAAQSEGLCLALRRVVPTGLNPGKASIALLKKLYGDFASRATGIPIKGFPEIDDTISGFDLLVIAESLRSIILAFLTPEETEEYSKSFGFGSGR